jgi:hypothetical protein
MAISRKCLFVDEIEQSLLEELTVSDQSSFSDESGTDDLTVGEVIVAACSENESDNVQFATASSAPSTWSAIFTWEDMTNYVGQREQFVKMKLVYYLLLHIYIKCILKKGRHN